MTRPACTADPEEKEAEITKIQGYSTIRKKAVNITVITV
jgi:hypothetical protein